MGGGRGARGKGEDTVGDLSRQVATQSEPSSVHPHPSPINSLRPNCALASHLLVNVVHTRPRLSCVIPPRFDRTPQSVSTPRIVHNAMSNKMHLVSAPFALIHSTRTFQPWTCSMIAVSRAMDAFVRRYRSRSASATNKGVR